MNNKNFKHYRFYADTALLCSIGELVSANYASKYTFEDSGKENMGHKIGLYDIYIEKTTKVPSEFLESFKKYEIVEMTLEEYERINNRYKDITYEELYSRHKDIIKPKIDELILEESIKVREDILSLCPQRLI